ncbi:NAD-dependent epimerase/dehydratase family protein [Lentiprolixibacter aurantiacus]|uniref:NAD(P)-dependent oxidoreductase n=1 Tax=Lentiprolixibacter aurantiacus TaxID=2993939 RepID=A0AAE3MIY6_9FLAO|nr:NAD(P)-dependent oxidoreductase [Lentiprolixibacter aurantiacus]MCX2718550.1 NAD(P)-dependent oxidoreductase [Lentiprolixibacter aurantiacus]
MIRLVSTAIIFGGSGYIGSNLLRTLIETSKFDKYYVCDINPLIGFDGSISNGLVEYIKLDVRKPIELGIQEASLKDSWIFNLAAVHREPGHDFYEYFDTNVPGAENINEFARKTGITNLFFTSSIAPYGRSLEQRTEESPLYPETGYGISKALAEKIHEKWMLEDSDRRLILVRPSVIFGPKDPGNVYRMIKALKKGTFILPNGGNIVKAYGYVYGLVDSILFTMSKKDKYILYNYAENPLLELKDMVGEAKKSLGYSKPTLKISTRVLAVIAFFVQIVFKLIGKKSDIHPVRVRKAGFPTNIKPKYLIEQGFEFKYSFDNALTHWKSVAPEDFE